MYHVNHMPRVVELGTIGDNHFKTIQIDLTPWLRAIPRGVASIIHIRPGETEDDAYIAATDVVNGILMWEPAAGDLGSTEGYGSMQIWLEDAASNRGKSVTVQTYVRASIVSPGETPEPQENWMEQMTALKVETVENAEDAADSAAAAADSMADAEAWAVGNRNGVPVDSQDVTYHNNSKYYAENAAEVVPDAVDEWLDDHPEATTTVQDKSIEIKKFTDDLKRNIKLSYDTVYDMVNDEKLIDGQTCFTNGYFFANDGGGACYKIRNKTDYDTVSVGVDLTTSENGLILLENGLVAELITDSFINVKQFGAIGGEGKSGNTDSTTAIQNALLYKNQSTLYFPDGFYCVTSPIIVYHSDQNEISHSVYMERNAVLYAGSEMETVLQFALDSSHTDNKERNYLDGEYLYGGNIDGNGLAENAVIFGGNGRMSCELTNFYDATVAIVRITNGRFNMRNVEITNNFNSSAELINDFEGVIGILNEGPDSHFWDIYLSYCKYGIVNNVGSFYERIHGVMSTRGYAGSIFIEDKNTVISTFTDCYSDNYNTAYKLKGSCNLYRIMAYYWMSASVLSNYADPVVIDLTGRTATARILIDGLRIIPTDTNTNNIVGIKVGDNIQQALERTKISNIIYRVAQRKYNDWLMYYMQKNSDLDQDQITLNNAGAGEKYLHLYDIVFFNYNKYVGLELSLQSNTGSHQFQSNLSMLVMDGTKESAFDSAYVKAMADVKGTSGTLNYYIAKKIGTMTDGTEVKIMEIWMKASEPDVQYMLSGKVNMISESVVGIPIRRINRFSETAPESSLTVNAVGLNLSAAKTLCEINDAGTQIVFDIKYPERINPSYVPNLSLTSLNLICNGQFKSLLNAGTLALTSRTDSYSRWTFTPTTAIPSLGNYTGLLRITGTMMFV